jgi:hypothetical protein
MLESQLKVMFIAIFDIKGVVLFKFIPQGQTVNQAYYVEAIHRKRPELQPNISILHNDSTPAQKALSVMQFLAQN